jgi:hypothetical protein
MLCVWTVQDSDDLDVTLLITRRSQALPAAFDDVIEPLGPRIVFIGALPQPASPAKQS